MIPFSILSYVEKKRDNSYRDVFVVGMLFGMMALMFVQYVGSFL